MVVSCDVGADALAAALRAGDPPVIGRIRDGALLLDARTLNDEEAAEMPAFVATRASPRRAAGMTGAHDIRSRWARPATSTMAGPC